MNITKDKVTQYIPYIAFVFVLVFFSIVSEGKLLDVRNLKNIADKLFPILIISCGALFIYAHGAMDLTIGGLLGVASLVGSKTLIETESIIMAITLIGLTVLGVGLINGMLSANFNEISFLPSLCLMFVLRGILQFSGNKGTVKIDGQYGVYDNVYLKIIVLVLVVAAAYFLFEYTKLGKFNRAIGGNQMASRLLGVNIFKYKVTAYVLTALLVGVAAFFSMVRTRSVSAQTGSGLEFEVMVALIFGGLPLAGGARAKFHCAVLGGVTATVLSNGMTLWGVESSTVALVNGLLFLVLVYLSHTKVKGILPR